MYGVMLLTKVGEALELPAPPGPPSLIKYYAKLKQLDEMKKKEKY